MIHIIAEAGTNHNGSKDEALALIDIAGRTGADSVKFQIINPWGLYLPGEYEFGHYDIKEVIAIRKSTVLSDDTYRELAAYGSKVGVPFSASVFDREGLDLLCELNPPYIKLASCDLNNIRFLRQVVERKKRIILSTGMSTFADIEKTVNELTKNGKPDIVLLHCVSIYPARTEETNLTFLTKLKSTFGFEVGFSDHTGDSTAACMALALGATWFEKHFTRDKTQKGFDHAYAMEEEGFRKYVNDLRAAEKAMQSRDEKISDSERYTRKRARRSLYASRNIEPGERIQDADVLCVRPEGLMNADDIDLVIGRVASVRIAQYEPFSLEKIRQ